MIKSKSVQLKSESAGQEGATSTGLDGASDTVCELTRIAGR